MGWETEWIDWGDILRWRAGSGMVVKGMVRGVAVGETARQKECDHESDGEGSGEDGVAAGAEGDFVV